MAIKGYTTLSQILSLSIKCSLVSYSEHPLLFWGQEGDLTPLEKIQSVYSKPNWQGKMKVMVLKEFYECVWYSLRLPPAFSYNALGFLKDNLIQNISVRKNKVHLDCNDIYIIHIYYTQLQSITKVSLTIERYKGCSTEQIMLIAAVKNLYFFTCREKVHIG